MLWGILSVQFHLAGPELCQQWDELQRKVRDGKVEKHEAVGSIRALTLALVESYRQKVPLGKLRFPVKGYTVHDIGGKGGSGFDSKGYDFYDGDRHKGHPAHDIFIHDKDQDCLSDDTGRPVEICSFSGGVVVGVNKEWHPGSEIRGGNYVWIFDPHTQRYYYYAHLAQVFVGTGDLVEAGAIIGLLGRTGKNAFRTRSPTHLHFMCLSFEDGHMRPYNPYRDLVESSR